MQNLNKYMEKEINWKTAITDDRDGAGRIRGYKIEDLIGKKTFAETVWLLIRGELPAKNEAALFNAILVAVADHGIAVPSITAARIAASGGNSINAAIAAGVLACGDSHGGAIENSMRMMETALKISPDVKSAASGIVEKFETENLRLPGYGHKILQSDPRSAKLLSLARSLKIGEKSCELAEAIEAELAKRKNRALPLNVDGAVAALLLAMGFPAEAGKAVFLIGRIAGISAHVIEEKIREKPFRRLQADEYAYDGVPPRELPKI